MHESVAMPEECARRDSRVTAHRRSVAGNDEFRAASMGRVDEHLERYVRVSRKLRLDHMGLAVFGFEPGNECSIFSIQVEDWPVLQMLNMDHRPAMCSGLVQEALGVR